MFYHMISGVGFEEECFGGEDNSTFIGRTVLRAFANSRGTLRTLLICLCLHVLGLPHSFHWVILRLRRGRNSTSTPLVDAKPALATRGAVQPGVET